MTTTTGERMTTMTTTYRHHPDHYRATARDVADVLDTIAHYVGRIVGPPPGMVGERRPIPADLGRMLDDLTDAVLAVERRAAIAAAYAEAYADEVTS